MNASLRPEPRIKLKKAREEIEKQLKEEAESLRACTGVLLSRMGRDGVEASGK